MDEPNWAQRTRSYLAATLPLDSGKAITFLPEQGASKTLITELEGKAPPQGQLSAPVSGVEARTFYEEVLSMPQEKKSEPPSPKVILKKRKRKSRSSTKASKSKSGVVEKVPTISQVFRFAQDGNLDSLVKALTEGHVSIDVTDNFNWTLLMSAAFAGHTDTVEYLLRSGAQWRTIVDCSGQNAVDLAQYAGHSHIAELIEHYDDPESYTETGETTVSGTDSQSQSSARSDKIKREKGEPFFCELCQLTISQDVPHKHNTSTLHQFNCQHHPSPHTVYGIPQSNRGYQMLLKRGWDPEGGLGSEQQGQQFPVKTILKRDRLGFGITEKEKARVTHFEAGDTAAIKRPGEEHSSRHQKKRDILRAAGKQKQWEHRMRQYMNVD